MLENNTKVKKYLLIKRMKINIKIVWFNILNQRISEQEIYGSKDVVYAPPRAYYFKYKTFFERYDNEDDESELSDFEEEAKVHRRFKCINCFIASSATSQIELSRVEWQTKYDATFFNNNGYVCGVCKQGNIFTKINGLCAGESEDKVIYENESD